MAKLDFPDASYSPWVAPNNVIYTYIGTSPNGYWEANTANAATNLTAVFVERTGSTMTGALKLDNAGSVSLPDISFDGDVNTGIFSPGADSFAITTAGTQRVTVDSSGRVGIGTSSPGAPLTVRGGSALSPTIRIEGGSAGTDNARIESKYNLVLACNGDGNQTNRTIQFRNYNTDLFAIDSSGRLLVGTSDGSGGVSKLVVQGASNGSAVGVAQISYNGLASAGLAAGTDIGYLRFTDQGSNSGVFAQITATADAITGSGDYPGRLMFATTADSASSPTERMRIDSSGNVGIGILSPQTKLHLSGTTNGAQATFGTSSSGLKISTFQKTGNDAGVILDAQEATNGTLAFSTRGNERMRIDSSGNVGIGKSSNLFYRLTFAEGSGDASRIGWVSGSGNRKASIDCGNTAALVFRTDVSDTERMRIDADGKVGIGSSNPGGNLTVTDASTYTLDIKANGLAGALLTTIGGSASLALGTNSTERIRIDSSGTTTFIKTVNNTAELLFGYGSSSGIYAGIGGQNNFNTNQLCDLLFYTNGSTGSRSPSERMRIDSSGNVGIGDTSPNFKIDVNGDVGIREGNNLVWHDGTGTAAFRLRAESNNKLFFERASGNEAQMIIDDGNVGIGTSSPRGNLHLDSSGSTRIDLTNTTTGTASGDGSTISIDSTTGALNIIQREAQPIQFYTNGSSERMRIDSSGRLLAGTSSPRAMYGSVNNQFQIEGGSHATSSMSLTRTGGGAPQINLASSANSSFGLVSNGGDLGFLTFMGADGSAMRTAAYIGAEVDGTPGTNDMPGRLVFSTTADGASSATERMRISQSGLVSIPGVYSFTTAAAANVYVESAGQLSRATSSSKYKTNVETIEDVYADALLSCRPVWYRSTCANDNPDWGWWGFIAEEVAAIDPRLVHWKKSEVTYDENGSAISTPCDPEPEGVMYDRFVPHLLNLIKRQKEQIENLEQRLSDAGIA